MRLTLTTALLLLTSNAWAQTTIPVDFTVSGLTGPSGSVPYYAVPTVSFTANDANGTYTGNVDYRIEIGSQIGTFGVWDTGSVFLQNGSGPYSQMLPFPSFVTPGQYSVRVTLDPNNVVMEISENNNVAVSTPFTVLGADLVTSNLNAPSTLVIGTPTTIAWRVSNATAVEARDFVVRLALTDAAGMFTTLYDSPPITLGPNQMMDFSESVTVPAGFTPGIATVSVNADITSVVAESSETNNSALANVMIRGQQPDFTIAVGDVPMAAEQGQTLDLTVSVANEGEIAATTDYTVFLSTDTVITVADRALGGGTEAVMPGTIVGARAVVTVPSDVTPGTYFVGAIADPANAVFESNESNNAYAIGPMEVFPSPLQIRTMGLPQGVVGVAYAAMLVAEGNEGPLMWSLAEGTMPPGLTLLPSGEIAGRPTTAGAYEIRVEVVDGTRSANATLTLLVTERNQPLAILTGTIPPAVVGEAYEAQLAAVGGSPPYFWRVGLLPAGLTADTDGLIVGTPSEAGNFDVPVSVVDDNGIGVDAILPFFVDSAATRPRLIPAALPNGLLGVDYCADGPVFIQAREGRPPYAFMAVGEGVPGLAVDASGAICGIPSQAGTHGVVVQVVDGAGGVDTERYTVDVDTSLVIVSKILPDARRGAPYTQALEASGGVEPYRWFVEQGTLPEGLALSESGVVSGTPTKEGLASLTLRVEDDAGGSTIGPLTVRVAMSEGLLESADETGCGCAATGAPNASGVGLVLFLLLALRRRR